jgi:hypothetical protein
MEQLSPLYDSIIQGAAVLITAGVGIGVVYLRSYVKAKIENEQIEKSVLTTLDVADSSLRSVILGLSTNLKVKLADGKLDPAEIKEIQDATLTKVTKEVAPAMLKRAEAHVGDLTTYLLTRVEGNLQAVDKVTN